MIVVRNVFQLKFGKAKDALALWKEGLELFRKNSTHGKNPRVLTDVSGPFYSLVFEASYGSLAEFESEAKAVMGSAEWQSWYAKFVPLVKAGGREIYSVVL